jgi:hypothetical protein
MTGHQLQVLREDLKVGRRRQKLPAKQAILKALREPLEPKNWCVPFFLNCVLWGFFPFVWFFFFRISKSFSP